MLALGVADMRPASDAGALRRGARRPCAASDVATLRPGSPRWTLRDGCAAGASGSPPHRCRASLDHNDLHERNVLVDEAGGIRFYDWGDSVVAHPFAAMLRAARPGAARGRRRRVLRARDAYLDVFSDRAPRAELVETLELACQVGEDRRALTWERALRPRASRARRSTRTGRAAPLETLAMVLDDGYLGG